jgi:putative transposase
MPGRKAAFVIADEVLQEKLARLIQQTSAQQRLVFRARIVLAAMQGSSNTQIAAQLSVNLSSVSKWRGRWADTQRLSLTEMPLERRLTDAPRPGKPAQIGPEALCKIMAIACQPPQQCGRPITHWTRRELAQEAIHQAIVPTISPRHVGRFLKAGRP